MINRNAGEVVESGVYNVLVFTHGNNGRIRIEAGNDGIPEEAFGSGLSVLRACKCNNQYSNEGREFFHISLIVLRKDNPLIIIEAIFCYICIGKHFKNLIVMLGTILYIAGLVLAILAVLDILKKPISLVGKIICCVLVLITSWVGLLVYYLYAKDHIVEWFK